MNHERSERSIEKECERLLPCMGVWVRKNVVVPGRFVSYAATGLGKGSADLVLVDLQQQGRAGFLEVKRPGEKSTKEQRTFREEVRRFGGFAGEVRSVKEVIALVEQSRKEPRRLRVAPALLARARELVAETFPGPNEMSEAWMLLRRMVGA